MTARSLHSMRRRCWNLSGSSKSWRSQLETPKTYTAEEIIAMIRDEYETWHGSYKPVIKTALTHLVMRLDPDATVE